MCFNDHFTFSRLSVKMAHFNFEKMLSEATKLDGPLQHGPKLRYERKAMEASKRIQKGSESSLGMNDYSLCDFLKVDYF